MWQASTVPRPIQTCGAAGGSQAAAEVRTAPIQFRKRCHQHCPASFVGRRIELSLQFHAREPQRLQGGRLGRIVLARLLPLAPRPLHFLAALRDPRFIVN